MPYEVGQRVGDYEIVQILGAGGMGEVYKVRNLISDRLDAMKVLLPDLEDNAELADRFLREIKVQARLSHPNIASLYTAIRHEGKLLMVMEFVDGLSLEQRLDRGKLTPPEAIGYLVQVLAALAFAHAKGVVHRDIKPANIMLGRDGGVKLMDFGIARMQEDRKLTQTGQTVGSLYYMSPEQIRGEQLDGRSDLYSLGISLYELVTGKRPYEAGSDFAIMAAHMQQNPVPPIQIDPSLPPRLNEIILMAIAKDPAQRFQSAEAFANALRNVAPAKTVTAPLPVVPPVAVPVPPSRRGVYMAIGSLTTLVVLGLVLTQAPRRYSAGASVRQEPVESVPAKAEPSAPAQTGPPEIIRENLPEPVEARQGVKARPAEAHVAPQPAPPAAAIQPAAKEPPAGAAADTRQFDELEDRLMKLGIRVAAIGEKVRGIAQQQAAQGVGLRSDVKSAQTLTNYLMDEAEKRVRSQDAAGAKANLDKAERQVELLERILGL